MADHRVISGRSIIHLEIMADDTNIKDRLMLGESLSAPHGLECLACPQDFTYGMVIP